MLLLRADETVIEVGRRSRTHSTWLTGVALFVMAWLPLLEPGAISLPRALSSVALLAIAGALIAYARRRQLRRVVELHKEHLVVDGERLPRSDVELVLSAGPLSDDSSHSRYRVCLRHRGGDTVLLESRSPDRVLSDLRRVHPLLGLAVRGGWGLAKGATPWTPAEPTRVLPSATLRVAPYLRQNRIVLTAGVGGVGIALAITLMMRARLAAGLAISTQSYALAAVCVLLCLGVAAAVWGESRVVSSDAHGMSVESRLFGLRFSSERIDAERWVGAWLVHTQEGDLAHLVLDFGDRLVAVACAGEELAALQARLGPWLAAASPSAELSPP